MISYQGNYCTHNQQALCSDTNQGSCTHVHHCWKADLGHVVSMVGRTHISGDFSSTRVRNMYITSLLLYRFTSDQGQIPRLNEWIPTVCCYFSRLFYFFTWPRSTGNILRVGRTPTGLEWMKIVFLPIFTIILLI